MRNPQGNPAKLFPRPGQPIDGTSMKQRTKKDSLSFDDVGEGPALILLHAFPLSAAMWHEQRQALSPIVRVITPDLPGFGDSRPMVGLTTIDGMADTIVGLLDELGIEQAILGGLSMGGYVALSFARRHGHRLLALILADTKAEADDTTAKANRDKMIGLATTNSASAVVEQMLPKLLSEKTLSERPDLVEAVRQIGSSQSREGIVAGLQALRDRGDATSALPGLCVPTLIVVGSYDKPTPPDGARRMAAAIPGAKFEIIEGAGHLSNMEQPERFNGVVRDFLKDLHCV